LAKAVGVSVAFFLAFPFPLPLAVGDVLRLPGLEVEEPTSLLSPSSWFFWVSTGSMMTPLCLSKGRHYVE
jgi:hypothetical protein